MVNFNTPPKDATPLLTVVPKHMTMKQSREVTVGSYRCNARGVPITLPEWRKQWLHKDHQARGASGSLSNSAMQSFTTKRNRVERRWQSLMSKLDLSFTGTKLKWEARAFNSMRLHPGKTNPGAAGLEEVLNHLTKYIPQRPKERDRNDHVAFHLWPSRPRRSKTKMLKRLFPKVITIHGLSYLGGGAKGLTII